VDATSFEFRLSVPRDARVAAIVRKLAVQAARYVGCSDPDAETFGGQVGEAVRARLHAAHPHGSLSVVVRRSDTGPLEVLVDGEPVALDL